MSPASRVGYVVSRFPKTTETFILREMEAVERQGWAVVPFAINREPDEIRQPGAERYLEQLSAVSDLTPAAAALAQLRLLVRRPGRWFGVWWRAVTGNLRSPKFLVRALVIAWGTPALAERAVDESVDHLHAHWGTHSALLAHLMAFVIDVPYSVTLHAHDLHVDQTMLATKLAAAGHVVTISEHNADLIRRSFPEVADRTSVVHCGVEAGAIELRAAGDGTHDPSDVPRVACVAGLRGFKGHRYLLEALHELARRGTVVECDLVGEGPLRGELEQLAGPGVVFHGALPVDDALDIVRRATIFVMPSVELADGRRDGIPVALMEAMAIGVPVISTTVSGIPELVQSGTTGLLVAPADAGALAGAIESLLADATGRGTMARYARDLVEREFDIDRSAATMCKIFEDAGAGRNNSSHD